MISIFKPGAIAFHTFFEVDFVSNNRAAPILSLISPHLSVAVCFCFTLKLRLVSPHLIFYSDKFIHHTSSYFTLYHLTSFCIISPNLTSSPFFFFSLVFETQSIPFLMWVIYQPTGMSQHRLAAVVAYIIRFKAYFYAD